LEWRKTEASALVDLDQEINKAVAEVADAIEVDNHGRLTRIFAICRHDSPPENSNLPAFVGRISQ
jgi:hypothetical protein